VNKRFAALGMTVLKTQGLQYDLKGNKEESEQFGKYMAESHQRNHNKYFHRNISYLTPLF
jgi:hypothetical protein